jgi:hypothetical protein
MNPVAGLAPQTWSVLDFVRTDLRTLRLAIATWEKGVSWRAQGWAGEPGQGARLGVCRVGRVKMATAATGSCIPRKSQKSDQPPSQKETSELGKTARSLVQARSERPISRARCNMLGK